MNDQTDSVKCKTGCRRLENGLENAGAKKWTMVSWNFAHSKDRWLSRLSELMVLVRLTPVKKDFPVRLLFRYVVIGALVAA